MLELKIFAVRDREAQKGNACLWSSIFVRLQPVFMHDPIRLLPVRCSTLVIDQGLSHPDQATHGVDRLVSSRSFPESSCCCSIRSSSSRILLIFVAKEVPLSLLFCSDLTYLYMIANIHTFSGRNLYKSFR